MIRKITLTSFLLLFGISMTFGQEGYYILSKVGTVGDGFDYKDPSGKLIMTGPANDVKSLWQELPFTWTLYGDTVSGYYATDNGFITFDTNATSAKIPDSLPGRSEPNQAIYVLAREWELGDDDKVFNWTYGTAPNRVHVVQWGPISVRLGGELREQRVYFGVRIYEGGDFDIVYSESFHQVSNLGAFIGVENKKGDMGNGGIIGVPRSINFDTKDDDWVYSFYDYTNPDIQGTKATMHAYAKVNSAVDISGAFVNRGTDTITSYDFNYQVDGGSVVTESYTNQMDTPLASFEVTHGTTWTPATTNQSYIVKMWIDNINGMSDKNPANDTVYHEVFVNDGISAPKKVLMEEFTSTECLMCPHGNWVAQRLENEFPDLIHVAHHTANGSDIMSDGSNPNVTTRLAGDLRFVVGQSAVYLYPYASIDRTVPMLPGFSRPRIANPYPAGDTAAWRKMIISQSNVPAPVKITIDAHHDPFLLPEIDVEVEFVDYVPEKNNGYFLSLFLVEEEVHNPDDNSYFQQNIYSSEYQGGGIPHPVFSSKPHPIKDYVHRNVVRSFITSGSNGWGNSTDIPDAPMKGTTYESNDHTFFVEDDYQKDKMKVVAFVHMYDRFDNNKLIVLNAAEASLDPIVGKEETQETLNGLDIYPNPTNNVTRVSFGLDKTADVKFDVYNSLGQNVHEQAVRTYTKGEHNIMFDAADLKAGVYMATITIDGVQHTKRFIVNN